MAKNYLTNGELNNNAAEWGVDVSYPSVNTAACTTNGAHSGTCLRAEIRNTDPGTISLYQAVKLTPGRKYKLSFYAKRTGNIDVWAAYQAGSNAKVNGNSMKSSLTSGGNYKRMSYTFTVPSSSASSVNVVVYLIAGSASGVAYFDTVTLEDVIDVQASEYWVDVPSGETVNMREDCSTSSAIKARLPRGTHLTHLLTVSDWKKVRTDSGVEGYIMSKFLSSVKIPLEAGTSSSWEKRYGTTTWSRSKHGTTVYAAVTNIQTDLKDAGYTEVGTIDGKYGKNTETAAKNFQKDQGLTVDGLFGNNSKMKLWDVIGSSR